MGYACHNPRGWYHLQSRQAFIWRYDAQDRLKGENLQDDKTSVQIAAVDPAEIITPGRVAGIHR